MQEILITGASSGIGAALAEHYAARGTKLLLVARRKDRLEAVGKKCLERNPATRVEYLIADVAQPDFPGALIEALGDRPLSIAYVNAGCGAAGAIDKLTLQNFRRPMETNVFGALQTVQASLGSLKRGRGRIVLIGSMNSHVALPLGSAYCMTKFAIRALAESLYCELSDVGVSLVCPGPVDTEILQIDNHGNRVLSASPDIGTKRILSTEAAAHRIAKQVSRGKREIFLTWDTKLAAMIHRHLPALTLPLIRFVFQKKRPMFNKMVGQVNPDAV